MSVLNNSLLLGAPAGAGGYSISRSLRFNSADSAFFSRTPASAGNRKTWTWAGWVKRSGLSAAGYNHLFSTGTVLSEAGYFGISFWEDKLDVTTGAADLRKTAAVYRDTSAWYHIVVAVDTTQATAANRVKVYVNGVEVTAFSTNANPTQNADLAVNNTGAHALGRNSYNSSDYFNGLLADIHFIDGQALDPTSFGEFSATTGVWVPKAYTGSYGTNGFKLNFSDNSTAAALGTDTSGQGNTWTVNNLSVTAGAGNDSLVDVPTNGSEVDTGSGGQVRGNYCTWNPLDKGSNVTLTNGNLDVSTNSTWNSVRATFGITSGKWYWEYTMTAAGYTMVGVGTRVIDLAGYIGQSSASYAYYSLNGNKWNSGSAASYGNSFTTNDVVGVAFDADAGKIWFSKNGTWQASGDPAAGTNAAYTSIPSSTYFPTISQDNSLPASTGGTLNAGARSFAYTAPSGFKALCTANLPAPVVTKANQFFDVALWSGDGTSGRSIVLPGELSPDFVWTKMRNAVNQHLLYDAVRGATIALATDNTNAETTRSTTITSFNSNGFTTGSSADTNGSGNTYVAWCWDAGSTTVTNTQGSITSSVRANPSAGFSVATYTGNLSSAGVSTVGHGLGVAPHLVITKRRDGASNWCVQHISTSSASQILFLDTTDAQFNTSGNGTLSRPTSSVFSVNNSTGLGVNGQTHVAYCFAPVAGYSSFGSYTGNGSSDGPFVYTGFRPRWVMVKRTDTSTFRWVVWDSARDTYNLTTTSLYPNLSDSELTGFDIDIVSNGFKLRDSENTLNQSNGAYIYAAFAESPFQYARAR
jgi:hypothetical protein